VIDSDFRLLGLTPHTVARVVDPFLFFSRRAFSTRSNPMKPSDSIVSKDISTEASWWTFSFSQRNNSNNNNNNQTRYD